MTSEKEKLRIIIEEMKKNSPCLEEQNEEAKRFMDEKELEIEITKVQGMNEDQIQLPWISLIVGLLAGGIPAIWAIIRNSGSGDRAWFGLLVIAGIFLICSTLCYYAIKDGGDERSKAESHESNC